MVLLKYLSNFWRTLEILLINIEINPILTWFANCTISNAAVNMAAIDLSKQQALDADPKAIQQINFTGNLRGADNRVMVFIIEEAKETILDFSLESVKVL